MKYFICALEGTQLGIPAEWTERIISTDRIQTALYETEPFPDNSGKNELFISLPVLFRLKDRAAPHGLVLKSGGKGDNAAPGRTVLLTPKIDIELDIPEANIHRLPESFAGLYRCIQGACFSNQNIILLLDPEKLVETLPHD